MENAKITVLSDLIVHTREVEQSQLNEPSGIPEIEGDQTNYEVFRKGRKLTSTINENVANYGLSHVEHTDTNNFGLQTIPEIASRIKVPPKQTGKIVIENGVRKYQLKPTKPVKAPKKDYLAKHFKAQLKQYNQETQSQKKPVKTSTKDLVEECALQWYAYVDKLCKLNQKLFEACLSSMNDEANRRN